MGLLIERCGRASLPHRAAAWDDSSRLLLCNIGPGTASRRKCGLVLPG